jgi:hypothetical protein
MSKAYKGQNCGNVLELTLQDEQEFKTPTIVWSDTTNGEIDQVQGDIPDNWKDNNTFTEPLYSSIQIGSSCTSIGEAAFRFQYNISDAETLIPDSVITIKDRAFESASNLGNLIIGKNVTSIGYNSFGYTQVDRIEIHAVTAATIDIFAFSYSLVSDNSIHVPVGATGYAASYDGLTVVYDL